MNYDVAVKTDFVVNGKRISKNNIIFNVIHKKQEDPLEN